MIEIEQQTTCKYCGQPLPPSAGRNHRKREYCNDVHRQLAYRQRREQEARASIKQRWSAFLPERPISNVGATRGKIAILLEAASLSVPWSLSRYAAGSMTKRSVNRGALQSYLYR